MGAANSKLRKRQCLGLVNGTIGDEVLTDI